MKISVNIAIFTNKRLCVACRAVAGKRVGVDVFLGLCQLKNRGDHQMMIASGRAYLYAILLCER